MAQDITNTDDLIDVRDIIARVEELREERDGFVIGHPNGHEEPAPEQWAEENEDEAEELETLESLLEELKGYGGDEQWEGDWYPITLVRDSYFKDYAQELAEDIGAIKADATWPNNCIDWDQAARELQTDYSTVEFDGVTYWYR